MRFRRDAQLDTSQVSDRRRMGAAPVAVGGLGIVGVLVLLAIQLLGGSGSGTSPFELGTGTGSGLSLIHI